MSDIARLILAVNIAFDKRSVQLHEAGMRDTEMIPDVSARLNELMVTRRQINYDMAEALGVFATALGPFQSATLGPKLDGVSNDKPEEEDQETKKKREDRGFFA